MRRTGKGRPTIEWEVSCFSHSRNLAGRLVFDSRGRHQDTFRTEWRAAMENCIALIRRPGPFMYEALEAIQWPGEHTMQHLTVGQLVRLNHLNLVFGLLQKGLVHKSRPLKGPSPGLVLSLTLEPDEVEKAALQHLELESTFSAFPVVLVVRQSATLELVKIHRCSCDILSGAEFELPLPERFGGLRVDVGRGRGFQSLGVVD